MLAVIAFFFSGRFNSTRRMPSERSVMMSLIVLLPLFADLRCRLGRALPLRFGHGAACAQAVDALRVEAEFAEDLLGVLAEVWARAGPEPWRRRAPGSGC